MSNPLGATTSSMSQGMLNATHTSAAQQTLLLTEELERTKKELQQREDTILGLKDVIGKLQQQLVYAEYEAVEANTAVAALSRAAEDDTARNTAVIQHLQAHIDELRAATAPTQSQAALMLQVERAIPSMLIEIVYHIGRRSDLTDGAPKDVSAAEGGAETAAQAISPAVMESIRALHPVAAIGQLRLWIRKLMDLDHETLATMSQGVRHQRQRVHESTARLLRVTSMRREKGNNGDDISAAGALLKSTNKSPMLRTQSIRRPSPNRKASIVMSDGAAFDDEAVEMMRRRNLELQDEMETMRGYVNEAESELHRVQQAAQLAVFSARRDVGGLRLELRQKSRQIETLLARTNLVDRAELIAAQDEASHLKVKLHETIQNGATALQAKKTEGQYLLMEKSEQIRSLEAQVERMSRARNHQRELQDALEATKREAVSAKQQLARANVKTLIEEKHKQQARLEDRAQEVQVIRRELEDTRNSLKAIQQSNLKMVTQYNELFEAKLLESNQRARAQRVQDRELAAQAVIGPNSELNAKYYRTRYLEALSELKTAQKKLKHLIFLSHHDHLSFHLQREDLSEQLRKAKTMLPKSTLSVNMSASAQNDDDAEDADLVAAIYESRLGTRPSSPSRYSVGRSPSPSSDDDVMLRKLLSDTSYAAYAANGQGLPTSHRTSPTPSRPSTAKGGRGGGYDTVSPTRATHIRDVCLVGVSSSDTSTAVEMYCNPRACNVTATMSSIRVQHDGTKEGEASRRTVLNDKDLRPIHERLEDALEHRSGGSAHSKGDVGDTVELRANSNASAAAPTLFSPKSSKRIAYLRKTRRNEPAGSLSRPMTPVIRPASAQL
jgi:hypothetical protein